ncbi:PAS domain-containing protein [Synechococcus sp. BDU 130192]|uniref:PAS domain-containing protein n=1 Tax=Synechococcus sp. BDU 130192 TaxID=2042059 RepID=UPI000C08882B|nr:PAS domain-containing protein [Synechococcus sp. BDU 130192]
MVASHYSVAVLSTDINVYQRLQTLLVEEQAEDFQLVWLDLTAASALQSLGHHDLYLSDAPLTYLVDHAEVVQRWPWIGLTDEAALQDEMLRLGVLDCFLWSELTGPLLVHTLRVALRMILGRTQGTLSAAPLGDFQGDRLQTLIQNIPGTVYRCLNTAEWHGIYFSETIEQLLGYPAADFLPGGDRHYASLIHPNDRAFVRQIIERKVQEKKPFALEYRLKHRDGTVRWVDERGQGVFDDQGNLLWLDGVIIDISEKKAIAFELDQQAIHYYEKTPAMLHSMDATGQILAVSDRWLQVLGYERRQVIGCNVTDFLTPVSRHKAEQVLLPTLTTQGSVEDDAYQFIKKNGDILEVELAAVCEQTNHHSRLLVVLTDVTARNHLAQQVNRYQTHLEDLIEQRTQALAASQARLAQAQAIAHIGVWEWDIRTDQIYWSPETFQIFGFAPGEIQPNAETFFERLHPDDRDRIKASIESLFSGQQLPSSAYRIITPAGEVRYLKDYHELTRDEQGQPIFLGGAVQDITTMQQTLNVLAASEARLRAIFDQAALGIVQIDRTDHFSLVNQAFCQICGYSEAELQQLTCQELTHPEDIQICREARAKLDCRQAASAVLEKRYRHRQGHFIWVKVICSYIYDNQGQPEYLLTIIEDITEYKQAEIALAESQTRYQKMVDGIPAIIYQYSPQRGGLFYSSQVEQILGYEVQRLLDEPELWHRSIHPEDVVDVDQVLQTLHTGKNFELEYRIRDATGNWHWFYDCSFNIHAVDSGDLVIDGFALDITERKNFDEVLRHRLKLETMLAEMSHLMVVEAELNLEKVLALLGRTFQADRVSVMISQMEANSVERLVSWHAGPHLDLDENFNTIDLSAYPWWLDHWQQQKVILFDRQHPLPETAKPEQTLVAYLDLKAVLWVPIQDATGQPWGYIACSSTAVDHLLWSKEDADILAIAGNLIYNYYQRQQANKQLELAKELAEAANHAKNQFLTSMSHELRTPLNAVLGFTQIMERSPDLSTDHQEYLSIIHRSGKHLLALLNDILNLAKFEKGTLQLNPNLFNLHDLLDDLAQMYALEIQHKNIQLDIHWDEQVPRYINADQAKLHSVLLHLLNNALKFTDSGCVQLMVKTLAQNPLRLRFSVTDTGIGIAETDFTRLFDNFVKLEAGDCMGQGSGLGLALSQKFVNLMGGEIVVSSQPGVGSCFSFELTGATPANPMHLALYPPQARDEQLPALTPEALQKFPPEWLTAFHQAALAARAQHLKSLIDQLPPQATAIARALEILVQKFAFDTLAKLSQQRTPNDFSSSKGETGS